MQGNRHYQMIGYAIKLLIEEAEIRVSRLLDQVIFSTKEQHQKREWLSTGMAHSSTLHVSGPRIVVLPHS